MPSELYFLYLLAVIAFFASPPDTSQLLIASNSIAYGLKRSWRTIAGDLSANAIQMTAAAFGLATLVAANPNLFIWVKWIGVAYLLWIGLTLVRKNTIKLDANGDATVTRHGRALFWQGFVTSMSNPFAIIFFASLFPQFIQTELPILPQLVIMAATYLIIDGLILVAWGWAGISAANWLHHFGAGAINKTCGVIMIIAAGLLALKNF